MHKRKKKDPRKLPRNENLFPAWASSAFEQVCAKTHTVLKLSWRMSRRSLVPLPGCSQHRQRRSHGFVASSLSLSPSSQSGGRFGKAKQELSGSYRLREILDDLLYEAHPLESGMQKQRCGTLNMKIKLFAKYQQVIIYSDSKGSCWP